ncbi:MAG: AAA family ATPase, partial [Candidatus Margulisbacteria bacterium]|nr:AAA family ATPase [Candidatus Margulisiibacteriota bacterium]
MHQKIYKRAAIDQIQKYLLTDDIIVLQGSRQVGKTSIMFYLDKILQEKGASTLFIDLEDSRNVRVLDKGVEEFLKYLSEEGLILQNFNRHKKLYVFIDEIQYLKSPSPFLKLLADHHKYLKLIVSGSSTFQIKQKFSDSLAGRTVNFEIYPLSFIEFLVFKNINLSLNNKLTENKTNKLKILFEEYVRFGAYP